MPSRNNLIHNELRFTILKNIAGKYVAYCEICERELTNTAIARLRAHRKICTEEKKYLSMMSSSQNNKTTNKNDQIGVMNEINTYASNELDEEIVTINVIPMYYDDHHVSKLNASKISKSTSSNRLNSSVIQVPSSALFNDLNIKKESRNVISAKLNNKQNKTVSKTSIHVEQISEDEMLHINSKLCKFFIGCKIPFSVIESDYFKHFCIALHPLYSKHLPNQEKLATTLLDKEYNECLANSTLSTSQKKSVLVIGERDNMSKDSRLIASVLINNNGSKAFINVDELYTNKETENQLFEIIDESKKIALQLYNSEIFAVLSNNLINMTQTEKSVCEWLVTCSAYVGNLLCNDILDMNLSNRVNSILKEFKNIQREKMLIDIGGSKIVTACETKFYTHIDAYKCFLNNVSLMRLLCKDVRIVINADIKSSILDDEFVELIRDFDILLNKICNVIQISQKSETLLGDAAALWINLKVLDKCDAKIKKAFENRKNMFLNKYALTAAYLHPDYQDTVQFTREQTEIINEFLLDEIGTECDGIIKFKDKEGMFGKLLQKGIRNTITYWKFMSPSYPKLSELALKLSQIPASTDEIKFAFSDWSEINSIRNRFSFETYKKFLHTYFSLKFTENNVPEE